jgi:N-acyl-D-amino-acid deacylase
VRQVVITIFVALALAGRAEAADPVRAAVQRALPLLQRSASNFVAERACFSCHHNALAILSARLAEQRGFAVDQAKLRAVEARTLGVLTGPNAVDAAVQGATLSDPTPNDSLLLMAAHDAGLQGNLATGVLARRLTHWQRPDGRWMTSDFRPPHSSSEFAATATAVAAIRAYMPAERAAERDAALSRATAWLSASWPRSTEDAAFRVMGLVWSGAPRDSVASAARVLLSMQLPTGGWPQLPGYRADAYSTGEALFALHLGGMPVHAPEWQRGIRYLVMSQAADGSWHVRTRMVSPAEVSPPYFHTGFPYRRDEFISYAGSCWAVMALLSAMPEVPPAVRVAPPADSSSPVPWLRTALFGTTSELAASLDAGLDASGMTPGGTTVLMASALDADKIRLLLARGANPQARSPSRIDALTIAASHVGTIDSVRALLDAGAAPEPPEGVRVRRPPLTAAALAGDLQNVALLLQHGATPSGQAISEAITFGHTDVVRALVAAGGDATGVDGTGINLLHWAAITNRPSMIPILANAGVPVNALDDFGFTPLMYAATIDHGGTAAVEALLAAGAKPDLRNDEGRTALQQARRFRHADAVRVLMRK